MSLNVSLMSNTFQDFSMSKSLKVLRVSEQCVDVPCYQIVCNYPLCQTVYKYPCAKQNLSILCAKQSVSILSCQTVFKHPL